MLGKNTCSLKQGIILKQRYMKVNHEGKELYEGTMHNNKVSHTVENLYFTVILQRILKVFTEW